MVRLNKIQLSQSQLDALFHQLNRTLGKLSEEHTDVFLTELLGKEERVMLAKRLMIIILLLEGKSLYRIAEMIKVSPTTAEKIKQGIEKGTYDRLIGLLSKDKRDYHSILDTLDNILHLGGILPHYNGLDRYRFLK